MRGSKRQLQCIREEKGIESSKARNSKCPNEAFGIAEYLLMRFSLAGPSTHFSAQRILAQE